MAKKISDYTELLTVIGTELLELAQAGVDNLRMEIRNIRAQKSTVITSAAGVANIDLGKGKYFTLALTENITSITFSNLSGAGYGDSVLLRITQGATARTVAWPASFRWEGAAPAVSTGSGAVDVLALSTFDNGTKWEATLSKGRV